MPSAEITLLAILLLFPFADLALEKFKFNSKSVEYVKTAVMLWAVFGFLMVCFGAGQLSVVSPQYFPNIQWKSYLAIFLFVAFIGYLGYVVFAIRSDENVRAQVVAAFEKGGDSLVNFLPESRKEFLLFTLLVSVSAGVCEELIFRWYLYHFIELQTGWFLAVALSSLIFGLWHLYLGWMHVVKSAVVGAVLCGVYLYFESIVVAIIAHILMDIYSGTLAFVAKNESANALRNRMR